MQELKMKSNKICCSVGISTYLQFSLTRTQPNPASILSVYYCHNFYVIDAMNCLSLMGSNQDCPKASSELASYHMKTIITSNMHQFTSYHISKEDATCESMPDDGS